MTEFGGFYISTNKDVPIISITLQCAHVCSVCACVSVCVCVQDCTGALFFKPDQ